jgi:hypothetical protein
MTQRPGRTLSVSIHSESEGTIGGQAATVGSVTSGPGRNGRGARHGQRTPDVTEAWLSTR